MYPQYNNLHTIVSNFLKSKASIQYQKLQANAASADVTTSIAASVVADDCAYDGDFVVVSPGAVVKICVKFYLYIIYFL